MWQDQHPSPLPPDRGAWSLLPPDPEAHGSCSPLPPDPQTRWPLTPRAATGPAGSRRPRRVS